MENAPIGVLIVDDEPGLRRSWEQLIAIQPDLACVGALHNADTLAEQAERTGARVVLLDLNLPGRDPFDAMAELAGRAANCRVVVCSGQSDSLTIEAAIDAGAWGFVDKLSPPAEVLDVIRRVAQGDVAFPGGLSR